MIYWFWRERGVVYFYGFFCVFVSEEKSGFMGLLEIELVTGFLG